MLGPAGLRVRDAWDLGFRDASRPPPPPFALSLHCVLALACSSGADLTLR